ncbi:hypothetical protein F7725_010721 [Dissostichus mawsoni]|uniref:Uncharacterized protein n=1 Tax=Dissostichus mawsoni TaxID=36200 RepID=A0A7J5XQ33_DISMA|nr:hypothetical protein F7725_010721 [Dissostichus mawsoni]
MNSECSAREKRRLVYSCVLPLFRLNVTVSCGVSSHVVHVAGVGHLLDVDAGLLLGAGQRSDDGLLDDVLQVTSPGVGGQTPASTESPRRPRPSNRCRSAERGRAGPWRCSSEESGQKTQSTSWMRVRVNLVTQEHLVDEGQGRVNLVTQEHLVDEGVRVNLVTQEHLVDKGQG